MLATYNEQRFIASVIEHLSAHGVNVYLIDNESTDRTRDIAESYLGHGVIGIETLPRDGHFALRAQCARKEELAATLDADWLIHLDADEVRVSSKRGQSLAQALEEADQAGYNAVNFLEFTFVPTCENPDHDHPNFQQTMRWYYPFLPAFPHRVNAWRRQDGPVELRWSGGHRVRFPGLRLSPRSLYMRHYLYISREHAIEKFVARRFAADEVADGWFGWRSTLQEHMIDFPGERELRSYRGDHLLDPSNPLAQHLLDPQRAAVQ
jgi:glycosyltransferase involved in cell wall biosynthesis